MSSKLNFISDECLACGSLDIESSPGFFMPFISHRAFKQPMLKLTKESTGLRDILEGYSYQYCNTIYCKTCGHVACDLRFNDEQMRNLYQDYRGPDYLEMREFYEPGYKARNKIFNQEYHYRNLVNDYILRTIGSSPKSILDWGGDSGINTPFKGSLEIHHIFDISNIEPILGAKLVSKDSICNYSYDLVVCQHVLEHLPFPGINVVELVKIINGNPFFYFEVPHEPIMRTKIKNKWQKKIHWHEHINFYSETSLEKLLYRCGLKVVNISSTNVSRSNGDDTFILQCLAKLNR